MYYIVKQKIGKIKKIFIKIILPFLYIFKNIIPYFAFVYLAALLIITILFVSTIKIKKPTFKTMLIFIAIGLLELLLIILGIA